MLLGLRRAVGFFLCGLLFASACNRSDASVPVQDSDETKEAAKGAETPPPDLADRAFPLLAWAVHLVRTEYFDPDRFDAAVQLRSSLDAIGRQTPEFFAEVQGDTVSLRVRGAKSSFPVGDVKTLDDAARVLESMLVFAQAELALEPEDLHAMEYAAIGGLLAPLDPHTDLLTPEQHADLGERTRGSFGGVGIEIRVGSRGVFVVRVLPGMPGEKAGLQADDVFVRIAGRSTVSMPISEVQELLRGPVGTTVDVKVRRKSKVLDLTLERAVIRLDSVSSATLPGGVEYIRVSHFQEDTAAKLKEALVARGDGLTGVVLDLRGNVGGLLLQATEVVDLFVPRGELVIVRSLFGREVSEAASTTQISGDTPVVVLVDEEAASAAEIVSGGLQALGRALVLGRLSFGKGLVQRVFPAAPYGRELALKITIAEYLVAGDRRIHSRGVVPDLELLPVEPTGFDHVVRYYDEQRFEQARERTRMEHHPSSKHERVDDAALASPSRLRYLASRELPEALRSVEDLPEVMQDPEVRIAAAVAAAVPTRLDAEARRAAVARMQVGLQEEEVPRIAAALAKADITWGPEGPQDVGITASARILTPLPIEAGRTFELEVSVTNPTSEVARRVHAITECDRERLDGIELLFGDIEPGQTQSRTVELQVLPWYADFVGDLDVLVHVGEPGETPDAKSRAVFETHALPRPALSYDVWIVDDPALVAKAPARPPSEPVPGLPAFSVQGNGDGMLQPGERVLLAFRAYNHGDGESPDVRAFLRNLSGEQGLLEEGFVALGAVPVGGSVSGAFGIWVKEDAEPGRPFLLDLTVGDARLRVSAADTMSLSVLPSAAEYTETSTVVRVTDQPLRLRAGAHASATVAADVAVDSTVSFEGKVGPWLFMSAPQEPSRRWFVAEDQGGFTPDQGKGSAKGVVARRSVRPPTLTVQPVPRRTTATSIKLEGVASHPRHLRDVVVMVRPPGPGQVDRKVEYAAAAPAGKTLEFEAEIPLEPGGNRVFVLARSDGDVQASRELWVYRGASD